MCKGSYSYTNINKIIIESFELDIGHCGSVNVGAQTLKCLPPLKTGEQSLFRLLQGRLNETVIQFEQSYKLNTSVRNE